MVIAQNTAAVNSELIAYTSPSTAENQNVSEKQYASEPIMPEPITAMAVPVLRLPSSFLAKSRRANHTMVRYRKNMVSAEHSALIALTIIAT